MAGAEDFFVLDVCPGNRENLRAEAEFAQHAGHGVICELLVVRLNGGGFTGDEFRQDDAPTGDGESPQGAVFILEREFPLRTGWDEIDFAGGEVRDVRLITTT